MKRLIILAVVAAIIFCAADVMAQNWVHNYNRGSGGYSYPHNNYSAFGSGNRNYDAFNPRPQRNYRHGGETYLQDGYYRNYGHFVAPHLKTRPDSYRWNNLRSR